MTDFLDELTMDRLDDEMQILAETVGMDAFKRLVLVYGGTISCYVPKISAVTVPVRNRHICDDYKLEKMSAINIASKYGLSVYAVRKIIGMGSKDWKCGSK